MAGPIDRHSQTLDLTAIHNACEAFETAWKAGESPQIEQLLPSVGDSQRKPLLRELLLVEWSYLRRQGKLPSREEYRTRFSDDKELIEELIAEFDSNVSPPERDTAKEQGKSTDAQTAAAADGEHVARTASAGDLEQSSVRRQFPRIEGFVLDSELGRGGMGVVYRARETALNREVAIKMLRAEVDAGSAYLERFEKEAQAVAELNDSRFVQIHAFAESDSGPYMVLEYVAGGSLEQYRRGRPLPVRFAAETVETLALAMQKAHDAGLVHRDLKPHNVLLTPDGSPKITDFGLVKRWNAEEASNTRQGSLLGTISYMSPEQSLGAENVGPESDIFALGGILYCLLTGRPAFMAATEFDTLAQLRTQAPVPPTRMRSDVPTDLETICLKCLEKDPAKRYASSQQLAEDINRFLSGRPIVARPVTAAEHGWRWAKRNPWVAGLATALVAMLLISTIAGWTLLARERRARATADDKKRLAEEAQGAAQQATLEAESFRDEAQDMYRTIVGPIDRILIQSKVDPDTRRAINDLAVKNFADVVKHDRARTSPVARRDQSRGYQNLGRINRELGRLSDAQKEFQRAYDITRKLAEDFPNDPVHLRNLAAITNEVADFDRVARPEQARRRYGEALELRKRWSAMRPESSDAKWSIAQSHTVLGRQYERMADPAKAINQYRLALAEYAALPEEFQKLRDVNREIAETLTRQGNSYSQIGNDTRALRCFEQALRQREEALKQSDSRATRHDLSHTRLNLGDFHIVRRRDAREAWKYYKDVLREFERMRSANPSEFQARRDLAAIEYRIGVTLELAAATGVTLDADGDAGKHFANSCRLREELAKIDPRRLQPKLELALALARCRRFSEAEKLADELAVIGARSARVLSQAAFAFALCSKADDPSLANRCRDKALNALQRCVDAGWKNWIALRDDPDIEPLRDHPTVVELREKLQTRSSAAQGSAAPAT